MSKRLLNWLDNNAKLGQILSNVSTTLAVYRGLPMLIGVILLVVSLVVSACIIPIIVSSAAVADIWLLLCLPTLLFHLGVIIGFIGFMMSEPLGRSYK